MKWQGRRGSRNIEDRRGRSGTARTVGGVGGIGLLLILGIGWLLGIDTSALVGPAGQGNPGTTGGYTGSAEEEAAAQFVSVVLADTEQVWSHIFETQVGTPYQPPVLVLFSGVTQSPCGNASGATGPFYCPVDQKAYLDTAFFAELRDRFGASGDFAAAYVVAHEIAHHVQNELGILSQANQIRAQVSQAESNAISVRIELQADCYSGVWARAAHEQLGTLERGDLQEALVAAREIGDDTLQREAGRVPRPHTFTHGTSEQRQRWFAIGVETGDLTACDTFGTDRL
ncbi:KPN_02809 family neutral zinc metallopeptidase [Tropicimonas marinistellae]|uniref:KPN_02809 family neutral zinc metallopeptidase n=1 Tax=Tropicimonas marinistellae TaxID=1739787 RepID=UPI000830E516|nr:neutral zinc metallopeptidase [Tropicimonas marinistellae]